MAFDPALAQSISLACINIAEQTEQDIIPTPLGSHERNAYAAIATFARMLNALVEELARG